MTEDLEAKHAKLEEAHQLLSKVEVFFVHELGLRHVRTTEVHEEMGMLMHEQATLETCPDKRSVKVADAHSLLVAVSGRRAEMLGEDHALTKNVVELSRSRSVSAAEHQLVSRSDSAALASSSTAASNAEGQQQHVHEAFTAPVLSTTDDDTTVGHEMVRQQWGSDFGAT